MVVQDSSLQVMELILAEFSLFRRCILRLHTASRWQRYLDLINSSLADYLHSSECKGEKGRGCYASVLESDLGVWRERGGVNWEDFQAVKHQGQRAVHYQIIDHKLYRQEDCMFGPRLSGSVGTVLLELLCCIGVFCRCKGVEHFILEIIDSLPNMEMMINVKDYPLVRMNLGVSWRL